MDDMPRWVSDNKIVIPIDRIWLNDYQHTDEYKELAQKITEDNLQKIMRNEKSTIVKTYLSREVLDKELRVTPLMQKILPACHVFSINCKLTNTYDKDKAKANNINPYLLVKYICNHKMIPRGESICHSSWFLFLRGIIKAEPDVSEWVFHQLVCIIHRENEIGEEENTAYKESLKDIITVISDAVHNITQQMCKHTVKMLGLPRTFSDKCLTAVMDDIFKQSSIFSDISGNTTWFEEKYRTYLNTYGSYDLEKFSTMVIDEQFKYYDVLAEGDFGYIHNTKSQIILPLILDISPTDNANVSSHYNVLIIDRNDKSVYLFEPYMDNYWHNDLWYILKDQILNDYFPDRVWYWDSSQSYTDECPPGSIQCNDKFCQTWIILVTMMHILNPKLDKLVVYEYLRNNDDIDLKYKIIMLFQHYLYHTFEDSIDFKKIT
jgi:hypothetical protein